MRRLMGRNRSPPGTDAIREGTRIKIKLVEDEVLVVRVDADEWTRAFHNALRNDHPIKVRGPEGRTLAINPHKVLFWEEENLEEDLLELAPWEFAHADLTVAAEHAQSL